MKRWCPRAPVGDYVCKLVRVPRPPKLRPDATDVELVERLGQAYRAATRHHFGDGSHRFALARGDVRKSKHFDKLVAAAHQLRRDEITPEAWADWRCDLWRRQRKGSMPDVPPITTMFSATFVGKHRGWFEREHGGALGGDMVRNDVHCDLMRRWSAMLDDVARLRGLNEAETRAVVERHFPGDDLRESIEAAREEADRMRKRMARKIEKGLWVWS